MPTQKELIQQSRRNMDAEWRSKYPNGIYRLWYVSDTNIQITHHTSRPTSWSLGGVDHCLDYKNGIYSHRRSWYRQFSLRKFNYKTTQELINKINRINVADDIKQRFIEYINLHM